MAFFVLDQTPKMDFVVSWMNRVAVLYSMACGQLGMTKFGGLCVFSLDGLHVQVRGTREE